MADWIKQFKELFPPESWSVENEELTRYSQDAWPVAMKLNQTGDTSYRPQIIFWPRTQEEVSKLLAWANKHHIPVTPRGAGSGVVGAAIPANGGILLDLSQLNQILILDETDLLVKAQAGVMGHILESELMDAVTR